MNDSFDFLGLPGIRTTAKTETDEAITIEAETIAPAFAQCCILVDQVSDGSRPSRRTINDTPHGGKPLVIKMRVRRAKCRQCGKRGIDETIPNLARGRHMTERLRRFIAREGLAPTNHRKIGRMVHVSEGTVRGVINAHIDERLVTLERETPRVLGLDEKMIVRKYRAMLGNIERRTILDMLPDRDTTLENYLDALPDKHRVEVVCMDMYAPYQRMIRRYLKGAAPVSDKFHVVRRADLALTKIRVAVMKDIDPRDRARLRRSTELFRARQPRLTDYQYQTIADWGRRFPVLSEAYHAKERFYEMYDDRMTPAEAERYYRHWMKTLPPSIKSVFQQHCRIQTNFYEAVFNYFDHPYTSGYVEAANRVLDDIHRAGRGYSFEMIRAKMLLAEKLETKTFRDRHPNAYMGFMIDLPPILEANWGIDLSRLGRAVNSRMERLKMVDGRYVPMDVQTGLATIDITSALPA